ncbi:hypothetical protein L917_03820 [Phytophthora nicotianae]|uniref:Uncharacterized protein n=1 Tax=Phytophthora nicotianae TaxID=4792 RepID=W2LRN6_PHYNI|nr:hypothetical protein L917_03820 [Phytophthora nicotianae]
MRLSSNHTYVSTVALEASVDFVLVSDLIAATAYLCSLVTIPPSAPGAPDQVDLGDCTIDDLPELLTGDSKSLLELGPTAQPPSVSSYPTAAVLVATRLSAGPSMFIPVVACGLTSTSSPSIARATFATLPAPAVLNPAAAASPATAPS